MTTKPGRLEAPIEDHGVIGNCRSIALISRDGCLDWLCWPRFDSPALFSSLLDPIRGGSWRIQPAGEFQSARRYLDNTNVLETRFSSLHGDVVLTDFMSVATDAYKRAHLCADQEVIRYLRCEQGNMEMEVVFEPRPNYGKNRADIIDKGPLGLRVSVGRGLLTLNSQAPFRISDGRASSLLRLNAGDTVAFSMTYAEESPEVLPILEKVPQVLERTVDWWRAWAKQCTYHGPYRDSVLRSALTLKLLEYSVSGAFVAAATTSLPERLGGDLNWDYRYCWLRDASLTMQALCGTGYVAEAEAFAEWTLHATRLTQPKLMVMYDVHGNAVKKEKELAFLSGHKQSSPVRVGNMAGQQIQLDVYGEVINGAAHVIKATGRIDRETAEVLVEFGRYVCRHWSDVDAGIWEPRSEPTVHTHSRLMSWLGLSELIDLHRRGFIRKMPLKLFEAMRDKIRKSIEDDSWDPTLDSYVSEPGKQNLDATLLRMAIHGFEPASSVRMVRTYERISQRLEVGEALFYRYLDGEPKEGAFGLCSFWAAEFQALRGNVEDARRRVEALLGYANDLGLFAEEIDPRTGAALGNFPQAFTHVGLINAALAIQKEEKK